MISSDYKNANSEQIANMSNYSRLVHNLRPDLRISNLSYYGKGASLRKSNAKKFFD